MRLFIAGSMQTKASALGRSIIEREQKLDRMFADKRISQSSLSSALAEIAELQGQLRGVATAYIAVLR